VVRRRVLPFAWGPGESYIPGMTHTTLIIAGSSEFGTAASVLVVKDLAGVVLGQVRYAAVPLHAGSDVKRVLAAVSHILPRGTRTVESVGRVIHLAIASD
jgi:hypothetical protein